MKKIEITTTPEFTLPPKIKSMAPEVIDTPDIVKENFLGLQLVSETDKSPYQFKWEHVKEKLEERSGLKAIEYFEKRHHFTATSILQISSLFATII